METTTQLPALTPEITKGKMELTLKKAEFSFQALQNEITKIPKNEDGYEAMAEILKGIDKVEKLIAKAHEEGKAAAWAECKAWDKGNNDLIAITTNLKGQLKPIYDKLSLDFQNKAREQEKEKQRVLGIKTEMTNGILLFTTQINNCKTRQELVNIQRSINLSRTSKAMAEFLPEWVQKLDGLNTAINEAKQRVERLEKLAELEATATEEEKDEISIQKEHIEAEIEEKQILLSEQSLNAATAPDEVLVADVVLPTVKAKRTTIKAEVLDINLLQKKLPHLVKLVVDEEKLSEYVKTKKAEGALNDVEEINVFGLRIYKDYTF
jgi:hypothetical protein